MAVSAMIPSVPLVHSLKDVAPGSLRVGIGRIAVLLYQPEGSSREEELPSKASSGTTLPEGSLKGLVLSGLVHSTRAASGAALLLYGCP